MPEASINTVFTLADKNKDGYLSIEEVVGLKQIAMDLNKE